MVKIAKKKKRILQTGSMQRSYPDFKKACELVRNGHIGDIEKMYVNVGDPAKPFSWGGEPVPKEVNWDKWCGPAPLLPYHHRLSPPHNDVQFWANWRYFKETGGGILADWGAHMFDIAQWALGTDNTGPVRITPPKKPNAIKGLQMTYANGVEMIHWNFGRGNAVRFVGSKGVIDVSRNFLDAGPGKTLDIDLGENDMKLYDTNQNHVGDWINSIKNRSQPICVSHL